jgi:hypothetical protein
MVGDDTTKAAFETSKSSVFEAAQNIPSEPASIPPKTAVINNSRQKDARDSSDDGLVGEFPNSVASSSDNSIVAGTALTEAQLRALHKSQNEASRIDPTDKIGGPGNSELSDLTVGELLALHQKQQEEISSINANEIVIPPSPENQFQGRTIEELTAIHENQNKMANTYQGGYEEPAPSIVDGQVNPYTTTDTLNLHEYQGGETEYEMTNPDQYVSIQSGGDEKEVLMTVEELWEKHRQQKSEM